MADKQTKEERICTVCKKEEVFQAWKDNGFDKCFPCAMDYRDKMREKFLAVLLPEQRTLFEAYDKAREDVTSMIILD